MKRRIRDWSAISATVLILVVGSVAGVTEIKPQAPSTGTAAGPQPSTVVKQLAERRPPQLTGAGEEARKNALAFIDWASASTKTQTELVRKAIAEARENQGIMKALCDEAFTRQTSDHSSALVVLSLIGEARSPYGEECLARFLKQPFPEKGTVVEGEVLEQTALATLEAKAIDGLAYLRNDEADRLVLEAVARHPARIVRAEAIAAYLWNHEYAPKARQTLESYVHPDEKIFLDRVVRQEGEARESFNRRLATYLKAHPEIRPPVPERAKAKQRPVVGNPPAF